MRNRGLKNTKRNLYIRHFPTALDACALLLLLLLDILLLLGHLVHPLGLGLNALPNRAVCTSIIQAWRFLVLRLIFPPRPPYPDQKFGSSLATWHCPQTLKSPRTKILPYGKSLVKFGRRYFKCQNQRKTVIGTNPEQKFGDSLATWHCPETLKSPHTKIYTYDKSLVKFERWYFQGDNQIENTDLNPFRGKVWSIFGHLALPNNTQKSLYQKIHL